MKIVGIKLLSHGTGSSSKIFWMTVSLVFPPAPAGMNFKF